MNNRSAQDNIPSSVNEVSDTENKANAFYNIYMLSNLLLIYFLVSTKRVILTCITYAVC